MRRFKVWTCGHNTYRLKDTANLLADGTYEQPSAEHVLHDYLYSTDYQVHRPALKANIV
jgi:nitronate monooxygenase